VTKRLDKVEMAVVVGQVTTPAPVETAVAMPAEVAVERAKFEVGEWNRLPQWRCTACPFDTLEGEGAVLEHWQIAHGGGLP